MKINLKLRFKNATTLLSLAVAVVAFIYQVCGIVGYVPPIGQDMVVQLVGIVVNILVALGIVVDPTTSGIGDSEQALGYTEPKKEV